MTPERLKLALTDWFDRLDFDRSNEATRHAEYAELLDIIRAIPPDARVKEALDYIKMADNRLECEGCGQCVSVARSYLVEALAALSHQPGTGEAAQKSAPAAPGSLPSGESDPSVTLDSAGADTGKMRKLRGSDGETAPPPPRSTPLRCRRQ